VLDFGIAKATDRLQTTRDGGLKGKVCYMAPEQLRMEAVDRRADVYAAGVVLWELVAGQRLRHASNAVSALHEVDQTIAAPSTTNGECPPELDRVALRALSRNPRERFQTAREFAQALEAAIPPAAPREVGQWVERLAAAALVPKSTLVGAVQGVTCATASVAGIAPATTPVRQAETPEPVTSAPVAPSSPRFIGYGVALAAGAAVASAVGFVVTRGAEVRHPPAPVTAATTPAPPTLAAPRIVSAPEPPAASSALAAASVAPKVAPRRSTKPASRTKPNCDPPYVIDEDGIKTFKAGCLK
jgi:serine/threonine-protein kinase